MILLGVLLILLGFGSLVLDPMNPGFLEWAEDVQPWLGIVVGLLGVALVVIGVARHRKRTRDSAGEPDDSAGKPGVGQWAGDGHWAGTSPSAPQTAGPLTGDRATGELNPDVEPTPRQSRPDSRAADGVAGRTGPVESVPAGGATGPGPVGGDYRKPVPAKPASQREDSTFPDAHDRYDGEPTISWTAADLEETHEPAASPDKGASSLPHGGRQQAGGPGPSRPDELKPQRGNASYEEAVDESEANPRDSSR